MNTGNLRRLSGKSHEVSPTNVFSRGMKATESTLKNNSRKTGDFQNFVV